MQVIKKFLNATDQSTTFEESIHPHCNLNVKVGLRTYILTYIHREKEEDYKAQRNH